MPGRSLPWRRLAGPEQGRDAQATITEEIDNILKQQKLAMSSQDLEELRNLLFEVSDISEKQGFVLGFRYAVALLHES